MLINKTDSKVTVVYNGRSRDLKPGEGIDIRDFDIENKNVIGAERHIMNKNPGKLEQKPNIGRDPNADKQYLDKIKLLEEKISALVKELADVRASEKIAQDKHASSAGEIGSMHQVVESMKKEINKYKAENEDLNHEVEQLRLGAINIKPKTKTLTMKSNN